MAGLHSSEAYDFSLFEEHPQWDSAQRQEVPQGEPRRRPRENVVELPKKELEKNARPRLHPFRRAAWLACFFCLLSAVTVVLYNQVQLTELTDEINTATRALEEAQSLEIQLNMEASQKMDGAAIEQYAQEELGMRKVIGGQVTYVNVAQQDAGAVVREASESSLWDKAWRALCSLFA